MALLVALSSPLRAQTAPPDGPQIRVGGLIYGQYGWFLSDTADGNHFDVTRAYININGRFPGGVTARITPDIYRIADGSLSYRLKYAFVAWNPGESPWTLKLGMVNTPYVELEERVWDYRMQGTSVLDRNGYLSTSDFAFLVDGTWGEERLSISAGILNGENYNRGVGDKRKDLGARVSARLLDTDDAGPVGGLRITLYAHYGTPTGGGTRQRYVGLLSYKSNLLTVAGVVGATRDSTSETALRPGRAVSVFGVLRIPDTKAAVIARVDRVDPSTRVPGDATTRWIGGVSYQVAPNLRVLADIDHLVYQSGATTPALEAVRSQALFQIQLSF